MSAFDKEGMEIHVGDTVKCINSFGNGSLTKGERYKVTHIANMVYLVADDISDEEQYLKKRFKDNRTIKLSGYKILVQRMKGKLPIFPFFQNPDRFKVVSRKSVTVL